MPSVSTSSPECLIRGGGPAGAHAAALIASMGITTGLHHRDLRRRSLPDETLVPEAGPTLQRAGVRDYLRDQGFLGSERHGILWGEDEIRWRHAAGGLGFQVVRQTFDTELRRRASVAGALESDGRSSSRLTVLACGGAAAPPASRVEIESRLPSLVALVGRSEDCEEPERSTLIEAVPEGWWWWLPLHHGGVSLTLFCDGEELRDLGAGTIWAKAKTHARGPARESDIDFDSAEVATPRLRRSRDPRVLLCGDAAASIDPLSSQGIEKALASAAEVAASCALISQGGATASEMHEHLESWHRELFQMHALRSLRWYAQEGRFPEAHFWRRRQAALESLTRKTAKPPSPEDRVAISPQLQDAPEFVHRSGGLQRLEGFRAHPESRAISRIGLVPLRALLDIAEAGGRISEIAEEGRHHPELFPLNKTLVIAALGQLVTRGLLVVPDPPSPES